MVVNSVMVYAIQRSLDVVETVVLVANESHDECLEHIFLGFISSLAFYRCSGVLRLFWLLRVSN